MALNFVWLHFTHSCLWSALLAEVGLASETGKIRNKHRRKAASAYTMKNEAPFDSIQTALTLQRWNPSRLCAPGKDHRWTVCKGRKSLSQLRHKPTSRLCLTDSSVQSLGERLGENWKRRRGGSHSCRWINIPKNDWPRFMQRFPGDCGVLLSQQPAHAASL